jgi:DNA repair exonuclease SbcCD ATPase subunit
MKEIILIKDGELALKGLNRKNFENTLIGNIKRRLKSLGEVKIENLQSTITIEPICDDYDFEEALKTVHENLRAVESAQEDLNARLRFIQKYADEKGLIGEAPTLPDKFETEQALAEKKAELTRFNKSYGGKKIYIEQLETEADALPELIDEANRLRDEICEYEEKRDTAEKAKDFLKRASYNLSSRYLRKMEQSFEKNYAKASDSTMPSPNIDAELGLTFRDGGAERSEEWYSEGIRSLISLCLRLALTDALFEGETPFLILDDPFSELDGGKLEKAKKLIKELGDSYQIIYLTCHESRKI